MEKIMLTEEENRDITDLLKERGHIVPASSLEWIKQEINGLPVAEKEAIQREFNARIKILQLVRTGLTGYGLRPGVLRYGLPHRFKMAVPFKGDGQSAIVWNRKVGSCGITWNDIQRLFPWSRAQFRDVLYEGLERPLYEEYCDLTSRDGSYPALIPQVSMPCDFSVNRNELLDFLIVPNNRQAIVIQTDGKKDHSTPEQREYDRKQTEALLQSGYDVRRIHGEEFGEITDSDARRPYIKDFLAELLTEYGMPPSPCR